MATQTRIGYATDGSAAGAAKRAGKFGLTGSGQQCGPVELPDGNWGFWTAHNYFRPSDERGELLPGRSVDLDDETAVAAAMGVGWDDWMHDALGIVPSTMREFEGVS